MNDPISIISVIASIISIMCVFLDIKTKKKITMKNFVIILIILCLLVFLVTHSAFSLNGSNNNVPHTNTANDSQTDRSNNTITVAETDIIDYSTTDETTNVKMDSTPNVMNDYENNEVIESSTEPEANHSNNNINTTENPVNIISNSNILQINPITYSEYDIEPIYVSSIDIPPTIISELHGNISEGNLCNDYEFIPQVDGTHRFEFSNVPDGTDLRLKICNSGWEELKSNYSLDNGDGLTVSLSANKIYHIRVEQYRNTGSYTLNIGCKKTVTDISTFNVVSDNIQYTNQENDYSFLATLDGIYRFEFSNVPDGTDLRLKVYNSGWEEIKSDYNLDNGDGLTVPLSAGNIYYIRVEQYNQTGFYTLNVGLQKATVDISAYTDISDSIQYTGQSNNYTFSASVNGTYRFEFLDVPNGTDLRLKIYNSGWEEIKSDYNLDNGDGLTVPLSAGKMYYIQVQQYNNTGSYTLNIGTKKPITDISASKIVSDSIQYTDQENDYLFSPVADGKYRFEFASVPNGTKLRLKIYNDGMEELKSDYNLDNNDGLTILLSSSEKYYIRVAYYNGYGNYSLKTINVVE